MAVSKPLNPTNQILVDRESALLLALSKIDHSKKHPECPYFKCVFIDPANFSENTEEMTIPIGNQYFDFDKRTPRTKLCDHSDCQPESQLTYIVVQQANLDGVLGFTPPAKPSLGYDVPRGQFIGAKEDFLTQWENFKAHPTGKYNKKIMLTNYLRTVERTPYYNGSELFPAHLGWDFISGPTDECIAAEILKRAKEEPEGLGFMWNPLRGHLADLDESSLKENDLDLLDVWRMTLALPIGEKLMTPHALFFEEYSNLVEYTKGQRPDIINYNREKGIDRRTISYFNNDEVKPTSLDKIKSVNVQEKDVFGIDLYQRDGLSVWYSEYKNNIYFHIKSGEDRVSFNLNDTNVVIDQFLVMFLKSANSIKQVWLELEYMKDFKNFVEKKGTMPSRSFFRQKYVLREEVGIEFRDRRTNERDTSEYKKLFEKSRVNYAWNNNFVLYMDEDGKIRMFNSVKHTSLECSATDAFMIFRRILRLIYQLSQRDNPIVYKAFGSIDPKFYLIDRCTSFFDECVQFNRTIELTCKQYNSIFTDYFHENPSEYDSSYKEFDFSSSMWDRMKRDIHRPLWSKAVEKVYSKFPEVRSKELLQRTEPYKCVMPIIGMTDYQIESDFEFEIIGDGEEKEELKHLPGHLQNRNNLLKSFIPGPNEECELRLERKPELHVITYSSSDDEYVIDIGNVLFKKLTDPVNDELNRAFTTKLSIDPSSKESSPSESKEWYQGGFTKYLSERQLQKRSRSNDDDEEENDLKRVKSGP